MSFARHQTFYLRAGWLAKAIDELSAEVVDYGPFSGNDAPVRLGIGKNMVQSLRFWVQATWIAETKSKRLVLTKFGEAVKQFDPFFEMDLTWWIIHYHLATQKEEATSWYYLFNEFPDSEFTRLSFIEGLTNYAEPAASESSYQKDYDCIIASYVESDSTGSPEDNTDCPLRRLGLLRQQRRQVTRKSSPSIDIPAEVLHLAIKNTLSVSTQNALALNISDLLKARNIGPVFNLSVDAIYRYLDQLQERGWLRFSRTAGLDSVILEDYDPWVLVDAAYREKGRGVTTVEA